MQQSNFTQSSSIELESSPKNSWLVIYWSIWRKYWSRQHGESLRLAKQNLGAQYTKLWNVNLHSRHLNSRSQTERCNLIHTWPRNSLDNCQSTPLHSFWGQRNLAGLIDNSHTPCNGISRNPWVMHQEKDNYDVMYCQLNEMLNKPKPSLPSAPPNKFVNTVWTWGKACWEARQKILKPLRRGKT